jgi:CHAD domain-containing protein
MSLNEKNSRAVFQRLSRQLSKLKAKPAAESVHKFRTYGRRVEAVLDELVARPKQNDKKLLKLLARLRRKAGRVRDLDVQITSLRNLKIPEAAKQKRQLLVALTEERLQGENKLAEAFDKDTMRELRKRLKRAERELSISDGQALKGAVRVLAQLPPRQAALTEKLLHRYRIVGKRARYLAELAGEDAEARRLVQRLKRMQDMIGDWHDWWKLAQQAEKRFDGVQRSPLVTALRNVTRAKFRQAVDALAQTRVDLAAAKPIFAAEQAGRKTPLHEETKSAAAAA